MARYNEYQVIHYHQRADGRIEPRGAERVVLSHEEAVELSFSAIVVSLAEGINGARTYIFEGKHAQWDGHLGWIS